MNCLPPQSKGNCKITLPLPPPGRQMPRFHSKLRCGRRNAAWTPDSRPCALFLFSTEFLKLRWRGGLSGRSPGRPQRKHPQPPLFEVRMASQGGLSPGVPPAPASALDVPSLGGQGGDCGENGPCPCSSEPHPHPCPPWQGTHEPALSTRLPDAPVLSRSDGTGAGRGTRRKPLLRAGRGGALGGWSRGGPLLRRGCGWQVTTHSITS